MTTTVLARIQMRRGLAAEWAAANPVLAQGELAFETDTGRTKIGDGETVYLDLPAYATYDQMVDALEDIEAARLGAETARTGAETAETNAETAETNAEAAQAAAEDARDAAQTSATAAAGSATAASGSASAAATSASEADTDRVAAQAARTGSETARDAAQAAQAAAVTARTGAETAQTGAQTARTGAETAQTGAQTARTGAEAAQAAAVSSVALATAQAMTSTSMASLAAGYAASAASVAQQDLSGVTAQALHRSPNAVTAMFIYDTSKDSDGGAWTEKCQHTSWWNEAINGKWLGSWANENSARVSNATVGPELFPNGTFSDPSNLVFTPAANCTLSIVDGRLRVTRIASGYGGASVTITGLTVGKTYRVQIDCINRTLTAVYRVRKDAFSEGYYGNNQSVGNTFVSQGTSLIFDIGPVETSASGFVEYDNISVREVIAVNSAPTDYFQLTTDGRFYRLNKNQLVNTAALATQTQFLAAGTYTLSSTTGSSGSVAVSGAATASHTAGGAATIFTVASAGNVTFTVTGSVLTAQCEPGSVATTYEANGVSRITEVFRGNKADFPRLAALVGETNCLVIYDLTEPGRPMWMRFFVAAGNGASILGAVSSAQSLTGVAMSNARLVPVGSQGGAVIDFCRDLMRVIGNNQQVPRLADIANRNSTISAVGDGSTSIAVASTAISGVAMTVLADAPVDPVTGLRVPTIAVATGGGVSVIRHNGMVTTLGASSTALGASALVFDEKKLIAGRAAGNNPLFYRLGQNLVGVRGLGGNNHWGYFNSRNLVDAATASYGSWPSGVGLKILDPSKAITSVTNGLNAGIANTHNTGWLPGDIRRAYLADADVGTVSGAELVANGTFDTDTAGWASSATPTVISGTVSLEFPNNGAEFSQNITTVIGKTYRLAVNIISKGTGNVVIGAINISNRLFSTSVGVKYLFFTAVSTSTRVWIGANNDQTFPTTTVVDDISVKEVVLDRSYKAAGAPINGTLSRAQLASGTSLVGYSGFSAANYLREPYSADLDFGTGEWSCSAWVNIPTTVSAVGVIAERAFSSGASIRLAHDATGKLTATAYDGTTTRTVTTSAAYNIAQWLKAEACYTTDGTLSIRVNGWEVATSRGTPLLTLNNSSAVLTIGNNFTADAPFPGSIALLKLGATVPTYEQSQFMYEQEKQMFRAGALSVLPDSGAIVDMAYDDATDRWVAVSATNESYWTGLVRNNVTPVPAGSFSRIVAGSGVELTARSTTNPGVDVTIPAYGLREELVKRAEAAARLSRELAIFDFVGGFTANTTSGSTAITNASTITYPASYIGARISGSGIPANTTIVAVSGTTLYLSAAATATATGVSISFLDFELPVGMEAKTVIAAGAVKQEGATKDYTRLYDGFIETIRFGVAPGATAWVQIQATRGTMQ